MRHISALTLLLLVAAPALAQNNGPWNIPTVATLAQGQGPRRLALPVAASDDEVAVQRSRLIRGGLGRFLQADGQGWSVRFDRRSGLPMLFEGSGISLAGPTAQARARGLLARFPDLFGADEPASFDEDGSDELAFVHARKETGHARDAMLTFVFNHGRLIQIHADRWLPRSRGVPDITQADALARLQLQIQSPADLQELTMDLADVALATTAEPPGVFTGLIGSGYDVRLAYIFRFKLPGDIRSFVAYVDAQDGTLLDFFDDNRYEGLVTGGVYPRTSSAAETVVPFALTRLAGATTATTDLGGGYVYPGGTVSTTLSGSFFTLNDSCGAPAASASSSPGDISLGTSTATDCSFSAAGHTTRAGRNAFFHLNNARQLGVKWLSGVNATATSWFGSNVPANVNLNQTCNAFWNGTSLNFFKSGSGCSNTGEISDVMQHEWGHGLDQNTKSGSVGDSAKGEAVADGVALLLSHDSCIGPNFLQGGGGETTYCSTGVRDLAYSVTAANISLVCPVSNSCSGALGYECHCESHILSGAYWKLSQSFVLKYGTDEGWARFERLYLRALPNTTAYLAGTAGNAYSAMLVANDDNGNVTDGTPDADLIFNAFNVQGLASGPQSPVNAVACPVSPSAPVVTATAGAGSISLSWNPVNGASSYAIVRRLSLPLGSPAYLPLASNVTGTSYVDTDAAPGFTYTYQVVARVGGCDSPYDTGATATAGPGAADDFSLWLDRNNVAIGPGTSTTVMVHTVVTTGAAQTIALSVSGLPAGVTGSFSPASVVAGADSALTLTAAVNALPTSTTMTVTGTAVSGTHAATATVTVSGNDFSMGLAPAAVTVAAGTSKILTVSTTLTSGVAESITMGVSGLPAGVTGTFSPASVPSGNSSTLTLTAASTAAAAAAAFTVSGVAASASHSVKGAITVTAAPGDFSIAVTPTSLSLSPGESETVTVSTATVSGTPQSVTLSVSGLPSGVTGSFSPATVTSGGTATLTLTAGSNASKGTYSVSIVGAAASGSRAATLKLKVSPKKK